MTKAEIQLVRSLDDKRSRDEAGLFVAEGEKLVRELLASDLRVRKVYHTNGDLTAAGTDTEHISAKEMERISRLKTPSDCLALVEIPDYGFDTHGLKNRPHGPHRLILALDGVQNPGNIGTIIRLADWFGITDILCSADSADRFNPKVVQATMGAITRVRVHYGDLAAMIPVAGVPVYGTFLEGVNIYDAPLTPEGIIVLGSEGNGISEGVGRLVSKKLFIPPYPAGRRADNGSGNRPESLNVAVAAAITVAEFRRRQT